MQNNYYPNNYMDSYIPNSIINNNNTEDELLYVSDILKINKGKKAIIYCSYPDSNEWRDKIFEGTIVQSGKEYLLLKNINNQLNLIWNIYINYIEFKENINF